MKRFSTLFFVLILFTVSNAQENDLGFEAHYHLTSKKLTDWDTVGHVQQSLDAQGQLLKQIRTPQLHWFYSYDSSDSIIYHRSRKGIDSIKSYQSWMDEYPDLTSLRSVEIRTHLPSKSVIKRFYLDILTGERTLFHAMVKLNDTDGRVNELISRNYYNDGSVIYAYKTSREYTSFGEESIIRSMDSNSSHGWEEYYRVENFRSANGRLDSTLTYLQHNGADSLGMVVSFSYGADGLLEREQFVRVYYGGLRIKRSYTDYNEFDSFGNVLTKTTYMFDSSQWDWVPSNDYQYEYDLKQRLVSEQRKNWSTGFTDRFLFLYKSNYPLSITETQEQHLFVYPNPFEDMVRLSHYEDLEAVSVFDVKGVLQKRFVSQPMNELNLGEMPSGTYFLRLEATSQVETIKVVKL